MKRNFELFVTFLLLSLGLGTSFATHPKLTHLTPPGGQKGTEIEVKFHGSRLHDTKEIVFYHPGIELVKLESVKSNSITARVRIAEKCRLGEHQLRLRTASGISDLRTFYVGPFPAIAEVEPNTALSKAQPVALNSTVSGIMGPDDLDHYRVSLKKGMRLSAEVEAIRLGRFAFDAALAILDADGKVLMTADDSSLAMQDPIVSLIVPEDGDYIVQVRETSYGGNADYVYRLHLGNFPRPTMVYPPGGQAGQKVSVQLLGDVHGTWNQEVQLPESVSDKFPLFAQHQGLWAPSPNWMRISPFPNVLEIPPNQTRDQAAVASTAPVALNGILSASKETDWFRFKAVKGKPLEISVFARRIRSPLDSVLEILDAKGKVVAQNDDANGPDSSLKFTPNDDGEFFLTIKDHLGQGGSDYAYRVEIVPVKPSLHVYIPQVARNDSQTRQYIAVPRGNYFATVLAVRRANFSGELSLTVPDLPSGIEMDAPLIRAQADAAPVVFHASSDAKPAGKLVELIAKTTASSNEVKGTFRHDVELVQGPNNTSYYGTRVDQLYVAVVEEAPFKIQLVEPRVPLVQGGSMDLKIVAERKPGFDEPINIKMLWNPPGVGALPDITLAKGQTEGDYRLNANGDAASASWKIALLGSATFEGGTVWVSSQLTSLEIGAPFLMGKIESVSTPPGQDAKLICRLDQKQPFNGTTSLKLMGLPEKITASDVEITSETKEAVFDLKVDPTCNLGSHKALFCSVIIPSANGGVPHQIASGGILRIVPPKKTIPVATPEKKVATLQEKTP